MTEIIEGNKLIAEFMCKTIYPIAGTKEFNKWRGNRCDYHEFELKYHSSWDWLMPVVEKIEKSEPSTWVEIYGDRKVFTCDITNENQPIIEDEYQVLVSSKSLKTKIEAVWLAVVEFIRWYNQIDKK